VQLYTPLLYYWAHHLGLDQSDAADLVQDVFTTLVQKLPEFRYEPGKGFRELAADGHPEQVAGPLPATGRGPQARGPGGAQWGRRPRG
jgi:hypothetical protein